MNFGASFVVQWFNSLLGCLHHKILAPCFPFTFFPIHLRGNKSWSKYLGSCDLHRRSGWRPYSWCLPGPVVVAVHVWRVNQQIESLSVCLSNLKKKKRERDMNCSRHLNPRFTKFLKYTNK